jgi:hypothetical protein
MSHTGYKMHIIIKNKTNLTLMFNITKNLKFELHVIFLRMNKNIIAKIK